MNVFQISKAIRRVGYNYGMPCWLVECGLGLSYTPEDLLRQLAMMGCQEKDWVVIRNGLSEKGVGTFVDALGYTHCRSEVEASGRQATPTWFTKADRWLVYWDGSRNFNFGALRRGQDMLITKDLDATLAALNRGDLYEWGLLTNEPDLTKVLKYRVRVYPVEEE